MTWRAASSQRAMNPRAERSAIGSSMCQVSSARSTGASSRPISISWWSAPTQLATRRASASSLTAPSPRKPTAKVETGPVVWRGHHGDDQARVETAAQHRAERDVGHEAQADGLVELVEERLGHLARVAGDGIGRGVG